MPPTALIGNVKTPQNYPKSHRLPDSHPRTCHFRFIWKWGFSIWKRATAKVTNPANPLKALAVKKEASGNTTEGPERIPEPPRPISANRKSCEHRVKRVTQIKGRTSQDHTDFLIYFPLLLYVFCSRLVKL